MVRHIVIWNFQDGFSEQEKRANAQKVKEELENLKRYIGGIVSLSVMIAPLPSSNSDVMLDSVFASEEALAAYQIHPEHVRVSAFVGSVLQSRRCMDFLEE